MKNLTEEEQAQLNALMDWGSKLNEVLKKKGGSLQLVVGAVVPSSEDSEAEVTVGIVDDPEVGQDAKNAFIKAMVQSYHNQDYGCLYATAFIEAAEKACKGAKALRHAVNTPPEPIDDDFGNYRQNVLKLHAEQGGKEPDDLDIAQGFYSGWTPEKLLEEIA